MKKNDARSRFFRQQSVNAGKNCFELCQLQKCCWPAPASRAEQTQAGNEGGLQAGSHFLRRDLRLFQQIRKPHVRPNAKTLLKAGVAYIGVDQNSRCSALRRRNGDVCRDSCLARERGWRRNQQLQMSLLFSVPVEANIGVKCIKCLAIGGTCVIICEQSNLLVRTNTQGNQLLSPLHRKRAEIITGSISAVDMATLYEKKRPGCIHVPLPYATGEDERRVGSLLPIAGDAVSHHRWVSAAVVPLHPLYAGDHPDNRPGRPERCR